MNYLNTKYYVWILVGMSFILYCFHLYFFPIADKSFLNYAKPLANVVTYDTIIIILFTKWVWKCELLYGWLVPFPNLNGTWKGVIKSTWINPETGESPDKIPVILTIQQSFTKISCIMRTKEMQSFSFNSGFIIDKSNQILRLVYSYDSIPKQIIKERSPQHFGTIIFDIINGSSNKELKGDYWTARKTSGCIDLEFWKKEKLEKYPKEIGDHPVTNKDEDE